MRLSLITVTSNNVRGIKKTFSSLKSYAYGNIEHIIVDNKSADGTLLFLKSLNQCSLRIHSEPDNGIYDAMNKGLKIATGDYIYFLNAGDRVVDLGKLLAFISSAQGVDLIFGNIFHETLFRRMPIRVNSSLVYPQSYQHDIPPIPACIFRRSALRDAGGFDSSFRVAGDVELMLRFLKRGGITYKFFDDFISIFEGYGVSENPASGALILEERKIGIAKNCPEFSEDFFKNYQCRSKKFRALRTLAFRTFRLIYTFRDRSRF